MTWGSIGRFKSSTLDIFIAVVVTCCSYSYLYNLQSRQANVLRESIEAQIEQLAIQRDQDGMSSTLSGLEKIGAIACSIVRARDMSTAQSPRDLVDHSYTGNCLDSSLLLLGQRSSTRFVSSDGQLEWTLEFTHTPGPAFLIGVLGALLASMSVVLANAYRRSVEHEIVVSRVASKLESSDLLNRISRQMAHDIRSPISALQLLGSRLKMNQAERELYDGVLKRMDQMAHEILSRFRSEIQSSVEPAATNLTEILKRVLEQKSIEFPEVQLIYESGEHESEPAIGLCQPLELERILSNVLNNAIEASPSSRTVNVGVGKNEGNCLIWVVDKGSGIEPKVLRALGREIVSTKPTGNGIGLFYAFQKVRSWGGQLLVESSEFGTVVKILLPRISPTGERRPLSWV